MAVVTGDGEHGRGAGFRAQSRGDIFPALGIFIGTGVLAGLSVSVLTTALRPPVGLLGENWLIPAGLGAILGLFLGLGQVVWRPGSSIRLREPASPSTPEPAPSQQLWDPWLDSGRDSELPAPEPVAEEPVAEEPVCAEEPEAPSMGRAPVRPRVISPQTGEAIRLDDEIGPIIEEGRGGLLVILGGPGSGKSTALQHLAAVLPPWARARVRLLEILDLTAIAAAGLDSLIILTMDSRRVATPGYEKVILGHTHPELASFDHLLSTRKPALYRLAPWDQDDAIEYLLANDRDACASVMGRLGASRDLSFLDGIPELCSVVLDRMARDDAIADARTALQDELAARLDRVQVGVDRIKDCCVDSFGNAADADLLMSIAELAGRNPAGESLVRLLRHRPAALLLAADRIAAIIDRGCTTQVLTHRYPRELVLEVARRIAANPGAIRHLNDWIKSDLQDVHPLVASLLHVATPGWRPDPDCRPRLEGAYLDGITWPGLDLADVDLRGAELRGADLRKADLRTANAWDACFRGANLRDAILSDWTANKADLGGADLTGARARRARFREADLRGAHLVAVDLWQADLTETRIDGADFTQANLEEARLKGRPLRLARFDGARFGGADLRGCDLEDMSLSVADFHDAKLQGAILTGTQMPGGNFLGADLRDAWLAEIDWPGACLRDADLRGANFHLGTTRSGMLDSPIACEGSRTGFYTDDFLDRDIKPAEEIRKANLRCADLRGANIKDVDFYLVDLRGARYSAEQARHLRRCRAILDDRRA
jgi:uncharacterized protein YjbI with pentapeptide repeats